MLGKKQTKAMIDNALWVNAFENIESTISKAHLERLVTRTVKSIIEATKGKAAAYSWSGGKDSLVLEALCNMAGINECMLAVCELEYPAFIAWIEKHKPKKLETMNTGQDMDFLVKHPELLFPQSMAAAQRWYNVIQHTAQKRYCAKKHIDIFLMGRRNIEGNHTGKNGMYMNGNVIRYSPLAEWNHEEVFAFLHYFKLGLPPIYQWKNGYYNGTHPWPARLETGSIENGWREIYEIDKSIVIAAARRLPSANKFLGGIKA
jgi:3'-phosphoadenosine 5'-phosphosulfate sulfotransferase (PAPS reductase)/FAD synthetase